MAKIASPRLQNISDDERTAFAMAHGITKCPTVQVVRSSHTNAISSEDAAALRAYEARPRRRRSWGYSGPFPS